MYLSIATGEIVSLHQADDCTRLHLALQGIAIDGADAALRRAGLGEMRGHDGAILEVAALRELAERVATESGWSEAWDAMIRYAGRKGWLSDDGRTVEVHVER
ncbi:hypothetical protein [Streptomyces plumbiresistens]|uniref:Uncharacterized protein n=1 Tax=Streptomyces plumbiresistens TaxID=511811 RepID=A0ABP7TFM9_9ACTN